MNESQLSSMERKVDEILLLDPTPEVLVDVTNARVEDYLAPSSSVSHFKFVQHIEYVDIFFI